MGAPHHAQERNLSQTIAGHIDSDHYVSNIKKEIKSGLLAATLAATVMSLIGGTWSYLDKDNKDINKT